MSNASYRALEEISARGREQAEALARPARIRFFVDVQGTGETRLTGKAGIQFGAYMLEEPTFTWGVAAAAGREIAIGQLPLCTAVVLKYQTTSNEKFFTGADVGFAVESGDVGSRLKFSLTFEGVTLRASTPMTNTMR